MVDFHAHTRAGSFNYDKNVPGISVGYIFDEDGRVVIIDYRWCSLEFHGIWADLRESPLVPGGK